MPRGNKLMIEAFFPLIYHWYHIHILQNCLLKAKVKVLERSKRERRRRSMDGKLEEVSRTVINVSEISYLFLLECTF